MARCIRSDRMDGCLKVVFKLGCAILVMGALALVWWFRERIMQTGARWFGRSTALPPVADTAVGAPTPKAVASGKAKVGNLRTSAGPDSVVLTPNEMASLIGGGDGREGGQSVHTPRRGPPKNTPRPLPPRRT